MKDIKYSAIINFNHSGSVLLDFNKETTSSYSPKDKIYISKRQLVKFKSKDYLLLLDGIIYEFDHQPFSGDQYSQLIDHLSMDFNKTLSMLNGEFVLFLTDRANAVTRIATSESGNAALFYRRLKDSLVFSNSLTEITKSENGSLKVRYQRIYDLMVGNNLGSEETCYEDILRLMPGHFMAVNQRRITISEYSRLYNKSVQSPLAKDLYFTFREVFRRAVRNRLISKRIGSALSSGLDSTAVTSMAASVINKKDQKLIGYTYKPAYLPKELLSQHRYDETILLDSFMKQFSEITYIEVKAESSSILESLEKSLEIYGEPVYGASNQFWIQRMHGLMQDDECNVMLTGQGGNYSISWPPPELINKENKYPHSFFRRIRQLYPRRMDLPYVSSEFLKNIDREQFVNAREFNDFDKLQRKLLKNGISYSGYLQKQVSLFHGFHVTDPTVDKYVVEFCLSLPYGFYHDKHKSRKLVRVGLDELLPSEVRNNTIRSIQASDIQVRMQREKDVIIEKLEFLNKNKLVTFVLEIDSLVRYLKVIDFTDVKRKELNHLLRVILIGLFLEKIGD